ncbi:MAG TPA: TIGR04283 family arsenosugar biosynthesis glycosyltransferase [Syntrophales bacterium]|nr:TIGR04283 family arsenosugar biosynthesis glycosyltransferase [Syntrophales bacterium]
MTPKFSLIIPVWEEYAIISRTIEHALGLHASGSAEIIVVDADPEGRTIKAARHTGVKTAIAKKGRGNQMNLGASLAEGDILIFLHADTFLPPDALELIETAMEDRSCTAGAFDLAIDSDRPAFRLIEKVASFRSRITRIPYGDQTIFIRNRDFRDLGGFNNIPVMEDVEFMQRIKKRKGKICIIGRAVLTSPRRWEKEGIVYTTLRNWLLLCLYLCGVKPERIVRFYQ